MSRVFQWFLLIIFLPPVLFSCTPFAPAARLGQEETAVPDSFSIKDSIQDPKQRWWETVGDEQLNSFVDEALTDNQTLLSYWARLEKAQAQARKEGADLKPSLAGAAGASYTRIETDSSSVENENYSIGLVAGYEVDLWGRIRATNESALLSAEASREDLNTVAMTLAAEVTERWVAILSQRLQRQLLEQQLSNNETYLELVELRFRKSLASALDVFQQRQLVERSKAQLPLIEMQERMLQNQLAVLLGRMPNQSPVITRQELPVLDAVPDAGLPVQLLQNRPDIVAAFKRLEAVDQDLAAARADRLPALRLTGSVAYDSDQLEKVFDNWIANLAASVTAPVFDGGRRKAEVDINEAAVQQQLAEYRQLVLSAVREVEDALISETKIREHVAALENQLQAGKNALKEAGTRYLNGLNDYLPVLTQLLSVQSLENDLIRRHEDLLVARISLYRAIGGSWTDELSPPVNNN
ncbi:MAG: efflux transporter outer membrane subunit [Desulfobacterales bacterium]|jgi:multidrug efflux system outer membrane protein|nr:efflux transporter outer membrane subunit [Desulfobacterales bacterium]